MSGHRSVGQDCSDLRARPGLEGLLARWLTHRVADWKTRVLLALAGGLSPLPPYYSLGLSKCFHDMVPSFPWSMGFKIKQGRCHHVFYNEP